MSTTPQLIFQIRPEAYATLTIEALQSLTPQGTTPATPASLQIEDPPIPQPVLDAQQLGSLGDRQQSIDATSLLQRAQGARFSRPWIDWLWKLKRVVAQGGGGSTPSNQISILAPSIDEADIAWYGTGTIAAATDPVTFNVTLTGLTRFGVQVTGGTGYTNLDALTVSSSNGQGRPAKGTAIVVAGVIVGFTLTVQGYNLRAPLKVTGGTGTGATATLGRQFAVGDFIQWNDPTIVSGAYSYEIDQITAITPTDDTHFSCTLARHANGAASGFAQYGSKLNAHASANFYRLINKEFFEFLDVSAGPQLIRRVWDNMCVAAVQISGSGISLLSNLAPPINATRYSPPSPGMRTLSGAAYISLKCSNTLFPGQTADQRAQVVSWETIRAISGTVRQAPTGATSFHGDANAALVVYVCYITPDLSTVGLLDTIVIDSGNFQSYSATNRPDGRQMPYHQYWPTPNATKYDWPPNQLPRLTGALDVNGNLQNGFTVDQTTVVPFAPDGYIDLLVGQVGTAIPGGSLVVSAEV